MNQTLLCLVPLLVVLAPDQPRGVFDGPPINNAWEGALLVIVAATALLPRRLLPGGRRVGAALAALLVLALALKAASLLWGASPGLRACYRALPEGGAAQCEFSRDNLWRRGPGTRTDTNFDLAGPRWRLGFANQIGFNYFLTGQPVRERLPFTVRWQGRLALPRGTRAVVMEYVGGLRGRVGGAAVAAESYAATPARVTLPVEAGAGAWLPVDLAYTFADGAVIDGPERANPPPLLRILVQDDQGRLRSYDAAAMHHPWQGHFDLTAWAHLGQQAILVIALAALAWAWAGYVRQLPPSLLAGLALAAALAAAAWLWQAHWPESYSPHAVMLALLLAWLACAKPADSPPWALLVLSVCGLCLWMQVGGGAEFGQAHFMNGGDDWLTYEGQSFLILRDWSLQGGREVFYYQPLYRYWLALLHMVFGDSLPPLRVVEMSLASLGAYGVSWALLRRVRGLARQVLAWLAAAALLAMAAYTMFGWLLPGHAISETLMAILVLWALYWHHRTGDAALPAALLAMAAITRLNMLPAAAALWVALVWYAPRRDLGRIAAGAALWLAIASLPLWHNVYYAGQWVFFTATATLPKDNVAVPPLAYLNLPWGQAVQTHLAEMLEGLSGVLSLRWGGEFNTVRGLAHLASFAALWAGLGLAAAAQWRRWPRLGLGPWLAMAPAALAWLPFMIYVWDNYYPRFFLGGAILALWGFMWLLGDGSPADARTMGRRHEPIQADQAEGAG